MRFVIETVHATLGTTGASLRAAVLLHTRKTDMFVGKHEFRRCLVSDRFMKLVKVGQLTRADSLALNQTTPRGVAKTVACPGCYQCKEVPIAPWSVLRSGKYGTLGRYGFEITITGAGKSGDVFIRVGMFLDCARLTTRTMHPHGAHVT